MHHVLVLLVLGIASHPVTYSLRLLASNSQLDVCTFYTNVDMQYRSNLKSHLIFHRKCLLIYSGLRGLMFSLFQVFLYSPISTPFIHALTDSSCDPRGYCSILSGSHLLW